MLYIIKNEYSVVLGEFEAETEEAALDKYAKEHGYESFDDMPLFEQAEIEITEKSSDNNQS